MAKSSTSKPPFGVASLLILCFLSLALLVLELVYYSSNLQTIAFKKRDKELTGSYFNLIDQEFVQKWKFNCKNKPFKGILLVVTFNFPFYQNTPLLDELYDTIFEKVVYCGAAPSNAGGKKPTLEASVGNGYFGYDCMNKAIAKYPGYKGYLYINDDMIVNWWNLLEFDQNKVWQGAEIVDFTQEAYGSIRNKQWMWWQSEMGIAACQKVYLDVKKQAKTNKKFNASYALHTYLHNGGGVPRCGKGWSDFFYVPGRLANIAQHLLSINRKHSVFLEISVNNVLRSLDLVKNFEYVNGVYLPDIGVTDSSDAKQFWLNYNTQLTFIHPFKLNFDQSRELNVALLKKWIVDLTKRLSNCKRH